MRRHIFAITILCTLIFALAAQSFAQEDCFSRVNQSVAQTLEACAAFGPDQFCDASGARPIQSVNQITTAPQGDTIGIAALNLSLPIEAPPANDENSVPASTSIFVFGEMTVTSSDPSWRAMSITQSGPVCRNNARLSGVLLQVPRGFRDQVQINGANISFDQTIFATLVEGQLRVSVLEGDAVIQTNQAQAVLAGFQWQGSVIGPYDAGTMTTLPVNLLPRIVRVALPGQVTLTVETNMRAEPNDGGLFLALLPPGTLLNVYGADLTGTWRHVIEPGGLVGWVPLAALESDLSTTIPAYESTPQLLTRPFGPAWGRGGSGFGAVRLRLGPSDNDGILTQLPADTFFSVLGRDASLNWIYIRLDEAIESAAEGWVQVDVVDLPPELRLGELPLAP